MVDVFENKTQAPKETQYFNFGQNIQIKNFDEAIQKYAELIYFITFARDKMLLK